MKLKALPLGLCLVTVAVCLGIKDYSERKASHSKKSLGLTPLKATYHGLSLKNSSFGFSNAIADLLWVKLLQSASHSPLRPDEVSWEFAQTDAITTLDPNFYRAYDFGAIYLSVFRRDNLGAKLLLEKWVRKNPQDWKANYLLGYHLYFEMHEYEKAAHFILKAAQLKNAPSYLSSLGVRLLSQAGGYWQALRLSLELYEQIEDYEAKYRLKQRIRALRYELQSQAWNDGLAEYRKLFKKEPADLSDLRPLLTNHHRELASLSLGSFSEAVGTLLQEDFRFRYDPIQQNIRSQKSRTELGIDTVGLHLPKAIQKEGNHVGRSQR